MGDFAHFCIGSNTMRDVSGSFLLGFVICASPGWMILLTGLLIPREVVGRPA